MNASTTQPSVAVRKRNAGKPTLWHRLAPSVLACMATLMALPAQAEVEIPDVPLQSGTAYPAPNIMFILDDSGSMEGGTMPDNVPNTSPDRIENQAYTRNTLYYNPNITYKPWIKADGTRYTGGTDYDAVYSHDSLLSDSQDLSSDTRTFYVPKSGATDFSDSTQYVRYDIKNVSGTMHVIRSELLGGDAWNNVDINNGDWWYKKITVPSGTPELQVKADDSAGDTEGDLYIRSGQKPNSSDYNCRDLDQDHASCTISNPSSGTWWIGVYADGDVDNFDISYTIGSVTYDTPTGRTEAEEITNYAIWYSYHRTRMKSAKAGASEAFNQLGEHYRVGYDSIWNRSRSVTSNDPSAPTGTVAYPIPTGVDDGLFKKPTAADTDTNRTKWFEYLHAADGSSNTPLQAALQRTGEYYESAYPWDSIGDTDISCRQSFAILTTDGYWNYRDGSDYVYIGDIDTTDGSKIDRPLDADGNPTGPSFTYTPANPYQDPDGNARDDTLADVAMHYWNRDLSAMPNNVPESDDDPAFWQHMVTFGVSIGLQGTLDPNIDLPAITNGSKEWPNPNDTEDLDRIDDLWHASVNGHGKFVAATRPDEFVRGLLDALLSVAERVGSASNVTANSTSLQANTRLYQASYVSGRWTGELQAFDVSDAGISSVPEWQASQLIPAAADR